MSDEAPERSTTRPGRGYVDAFLSYSRTDRDAARLLASALEARGRSLWVDWDGIPPTAEWMQEIREAIQRSDAIVFVLSPDSASSRVCGVEIEQALIEGKRIIPVVVRDVSPGDVAPELAKRQWIRMGADVDEAADAVAAALDVDLDAVKQHTRLTVKAAEWEAHGRDRSRVLRGAELAEAEHWLAAPGRGVSPTPAVTQFIVASRQAAVRRQRVLVSFISVALVIALVLGAFALVQRRSAVEQRDLATTQALASASLASLSTDPQTSLLLALEADASGRTAAVDEALRRSVLASDVALELTPCDPGEAMGDLTFSSDGASLWTSCRSRGLQRFDATTGELTLGGPGTPQAALGGMSAIASPYGDQPFLVGSFGPGLKVVDPTTGAISDSGWTGPVIYALNTSQDGSTVAVANVEGVARLLDSRTGALLKEFPAAPGEIYSAQLDPSGKRLAVSGADGVVRIFDAATAKLLHRLTIGSATGLALWSPSGRYLLTTSQDRVARVWETTTWSTVQLLGHDALINDAAWAGGDGYVVTADSGGGIRVWSVATGAILSQLVGHSEWVSFLAVSADGTRVASASEDGTVRVWRWGPSLPLVVAPTKNWVTGLSVSPDGSTVAAASEGDGTVLYDTATGARVRVLDKEAVAAPAYSPDGASVLVSVYGVPGAGVRLVDAATGAVRWASTPLETITEPDFTTPDARPVTRAYGVLGSAFSPDGSRVALATELGVTVLDARDGHVLSTYLGEPETHNLNSFLMFATVRGLAWMPDGSAVLAPDGPDVVRVDPATGAELARLSGHTAPVIAVVVAPDGRTAVSTSEDGTARVWDLATGGTERILQHQARVAAAAFAANGLLATTSRDGNVSVWDQAGTLIMRTRVATIEATAVGWSIDSQRLLVGSGEGVDERVGFGSAGGLRRYGAVQELECPVCGDHAGLVALAHDHAIRSLTPAEVEAAVSGTAFAPPPIATASASASASGGSAASDLVGTWTTVMDAASLPPDQGYLAGRLLLRVLPDGSSLIYSNGAGADHGRVTTADSSLSITSEQCGTDVGTYGWSVSGSTLTLTLEKDPCPNRSAVLTAAPLSRPS